MNNNIYICKICGFTVTAQKSTSFTNHLKREHCIFDIENYIRTYEPERVTVCKTCGKPTAFVSYNNGFKDHCCNSCAKKDPETIKKCKDTYLAHFGVDNNFKSKECRDKIKATNLQKYGAENFMQTAVGVEKVKNTCLARYGTESYTQTNEYLLRCKDTYLQKYGVEHYSKTDQYKEKVKTTCLERYGVESYAQTDESKLRYKNTCLERYGVENYAQTDDFSIKSRKTCFEHYGVEFPQQAPTIIEKRKISKRKQRYPMLLKQLSQKHISLLDDIDNFSKNKLHKYYCDIHNIKFESKGMNIQTIICPECHNSIVSIKEQELYNWLSSYVECDQSNRKILDDNKERDIYIPSKNIAIEFDGIYWHNNLHKDNNYHLNKTLECESKNIQLIHVFENEWDNKQDIVKSVILSKLGIYKNKIMARKCNIKELSVNEYQEFTEINHLQGYTPAKTKLGLFFNNELVQICSFGKSRFKDNEIELLRQCTKLNTIVIGGFTKLLSYYVKNYHPTNLVSYCDRRYSIGTGYISSGWQLESVSKPNYFYIVNNILESRLKYQKHKLKKMLPTFDETLSEQDNMCLNNYYWIYDCGNLKYKYIKLGELINGF